MSSRQTIDLRSCNRIMILSLLAFFFKSIISYVRPFRLASRRQQCALHLLKIASVRHQRNPLEHTTFAYEIDGFSHFAQRCLCKWNCSRHDETFKNMLRTQPLSHRKVLTTYLFLIKTDDHGCATNACGRRNDPGRL